MSKARKAPLVYLEDIIEAIAKIEKYTKKCSQKSFLNNDLVIDAVIRNFEIIGEAAKKVPVEIKRKYPKIEWKEAAGFRDVLIHEYAGIEKATIWETLKTNIPLFKKQISEVIDKEKKNLK